MTELKTEKQYEWFLIDVSQQTLNGRNKLHLQWRCVDADYTVSERVALIDENTPGSRMVELMRRIDPTLNGTTLPKPVHFFVKGKVHFFAKVQRHWLEKRGADDVVVYEFVYESIKPLVEKPKTVITDAMRTKTKFIANKAKSVTHARELFRKDAPDLMFVFEQLVQNGEVVFT